MPTAPISATYQGQVDNTAISNKGAIDWNTDIRSVTTGTAATTYTSNSLISSAIGVYSFEAKGQWYAGCYRTFLFFDVSSITASNTITAATLQVLGYTNSSGGVIPVEGTAWGVNGSSSTLTTSDYSNLTFNTTYASQITSDSWNTSAYNDFTLNATAISAMNSNGYLNCVLINNTYDQGNTTLSLGTEEYNGVEFLDGTSNIRVSLTYSSTAGYGNIVNGVASANIGEVIGVASANISKVIGV